MDLPFDGDNEFIDRSFKRVIYAGKVVKGKTFQDCTFANCSFQESTFQNCKFRDCTFSDCNLRLVHVPGSSFRETEFKKSTLTGVNWVEGSWSKSGLLESIGFVDCDVSYNNFLGLALAKTVLTKCVAKNADFAEADLSEATLSETDFTEARFLHTNLSKADFTNARNYAIDPSLNTLKEAKFSLPEAVNLLRCMNIILVE